MTRRDTRLASLRFRSAPRLSRRYDRLMLPCRPTYSPDRCTHAPAFFAARAAASVSHCPAVDTSCKRMHGVFYYSELGPHFVDFPLVSPCCFSCSGASS